MTPSEPVKASPVPRAQTYIKKKDGTEPTKPIIPAKPPVKRGSGTSTGKTENSEPPKLPQKPANIEEELISQVNNEPITVPVAEPEVEVPTQTENPPTPDTPPAVTMPVVTPPVRERALPGSKTQPYLKNKESEPANEETQTQEAISTNESPQTTPTTQPAAPVRASPVPRAATYLKKKETNSDEPEATTPSPIPAKPVGPSRAGPSRQDSISKSLRPETMIIVPKLEESLKLGKMLSPATASQVPKSDFTTNKLDKVEKPEGKILLVVKKFHSTFFTLLNSIYFFSSFLKFYFHMYSIIFLEFFIILLKKFNFAVFFTTF